MKSLFKHLRSIAKVDMSSQMQREPNRKPSLFSPAFGLFCVLTVAQLLVSQKAEAVPLSLKRTFTGYYDYVVTGGSLRTQPNSANSCSVTNSNTAPVSGIPATATIKAAYLYWAGSSNTPDNTVTFQGQSVQADTVLTDTFTLSGTTYRWFSGIKDVTSIVTTTRNGNYTLSDLSVATGSPWCDIQGVLSGWSLIVIYEDTTTVTRPFAINLYDGFSVSRNASQDFTLSGIKVSNAPISKFTALLWEGDDSLGGTNEFFSFQGNKLSDSFNPVNNPFNSSINTRGLGADQVYGVDLDTFDVSTFTSPGLTSVTGRVSSNNDLVILSAVIVGVTTLAADLEVSKTVNTPNPVVGQNITYTVTVTNKGSDNTTGVVVKDVLPSQVTHVSNNSGGSYNPANGNWSVGNLNVGETKTLNITVTVNSTGTFSNTAEVITSDLPDLDSTPNNNNSTEDDQASISVTTSSTTTISGTLYEDTDGDNNLGGTEAKLPANITVNLLDNSNNIITTTNTDNNGNYTFTGVSNGDYKIQVDTTDTDIPTGYTLGTPNDLAVTVSGSAITDQNFGFDKSTNPNVLLIKRITKINDGTTTNSGDNLGIYNQEESNPYDDNKIDITELPQNESDPKPDTDKWVDTTSDTSSTFLIGGINGGKVKPDDEIEYTIYFLSTGDTEAKSVLFCDRVPSNVTFIPTSFNNQPQATAGSQNSDRGILWLKDGNTQSLTNVKDGDAAQYFPPGVEPSTIYPNIKCDGTNTNGAVVVNLENLPNATAPGTPTDSYGFIRFRGRVK
ncbi:MAG: DUF11 domain-containing protein [Rivularia sp. T60_A2020_040]|nr:DUF11 domain-containing protein [Rivularia sp. T60_A2020_040]